MPADLAALKAELLEIDQRLQRAAHEAEDGDAAGSVTLLKQHLDDRLTSLDGSTWQLLLAEWRYDFALLFDHIRQWMARVDANFTSTSVPKE